MLVHVTRFTSVQAEVKRQVEEELRRITRRLRLGEGAGTDTVMSHLRQLWEEDFIVTTQGVIEEIEDPAITILSRRMLRYTSPRRRKIRVTGDKRHFDLMSLLSAATSFLAGSRWKI